MGTMAKKDKYIRKTIPTYIHLGPDEYGKLRALALEDRESLGDLLARLAREYIAQRTGKANAVQQK